jgi:hypothetical protein
MRYALFITVSIAVEVAVLTTGEQSTPIDGDFDRTKIEEVTAGPHTPLPPAWSRPATGLWWRKAPSSISERSKMTTSLTDLLS